MNIDKWMVDYWISLSCIPASSSSYLSPRILIKADTPYPCNLLINGNNIQFSLLLHKYIIIWQTNPQTLINPNNIIHHLIAITTTHISFRNILPHPSHRYIASSSIFPMAAFDSRYSVDKTDSQVSVRDDVDGQRETVSIKNISIENNM